MSRAKKKNRASLREAPMQFRLGTELNHLVGSFAAAHGLESNEAAKCLVALCAIGLDCRFYGLVHQMEDAMGGTNPFAQSCVHLDTALKGAERLRGEPLQHDPGRALFILQTVRDFRASKGLDTDVQGLWFLPQETETKAADQPSSARSQGRPRRVVHPNVAEELGHRLREIKASEQREESHRIPQPEREA
jgi:hypothetical protein